MNDEHKDHDKMLASPPPPTSEKSIGTSFGPPHSCIHRRRLKKPAGPTGKFVQYEQTEFGKEVGRDEINPSGYGPV